MLAESGVALGCAEPSGRALLEPLDKATESRSECQYSNSGHTLFCRESGEKCLSRRAGLKKAKKKESSRLPPTHPFEVKHEPEYIQDEGLSS